MNNEKQLDLAVQMYASDFQDWFPPNPDDGGTSAGYEWCGGNVSGGMPGYTPGLEAFNPDYLKNASIVLVAPYVAYSITVWKCPADQRTGQYTGTNPALVGKVVPVTRSVSMSSAVGSEDSTWALSGSGHDGASVSTSGSWLDGSRHGNKHNLPWATFGKTADFVRTSAANIIMTVDESPWSINDACLGISAGTPQIVDWPATYHAGACGFGFCDGHAEIHKWRSGRMTLNGPASTVSATGDLLPDWNWLWTHATVRMQ